MERIMTMEERIKRAEEIYERRQRGENRPIIQQTEINRTKKDIKLLKKMIKQVLICVLIYLVINSIYNNKYVFSQDFINQANQLLSYNTDFNKIFNDLKQQIQNNLKTLNQTQNQEQNNIQQDNQNNQEQNTEQQKQENVELNAIGGAEPKEQPKTQEEQDIENIKNTTTFIKPVEGIITSKYGIREPETETVPKNHTGTDIAAVTGTKIKSSTNGEVVLVSEEGDYGKHLKIQIGEVSIIYAHCNQIYVKQGDIVTQGQEIAEVGSTGNSTGPHLHFEIRYKEITVDPQKILEL